MHYTPESLKMRFLFCLFVSRLRGNLANDDPRKTFRNSLRFFRLCRRPSLLQFVSRANHHILSSLHASLSSPASKASSIYLRWWRQRSMEHHKRIVWYRRPPSPRLSSSLVNRRRFRNWRARLEAFRLLGNAVSLRYVRNCYLRLGLHVPRNGRMVLLGRCLLQLCLLRDNRLWRFSFPPGEVLRLFWNGLQTNCLCDNDIWLLLYLLAFKCNVNCDKASVELAHSEDSLLWVLPVLLCLLPVLYGYSPEKVQHKEETT